MPEIPRETGQKTSESAPLPCGVSLWDVTPVRPDDIEHLVVKEAIGGQHVPCARHKRRAAGRRDAAAGLGDDQPAAGDVPGLEVRFPEAVHASRGDPAQIDRRRPEATYGP